MLQEDIITQQKYFFTSYFVNPFATFHTLERRENVYKLAYALLHLPLGLAQGGDTSPARGEEAAPQIPRGGDIAGEDRGRLPAPRLHPVPDSPRGWPGAWMRGETLRLAEGQLVRRPAGAAAGGLSLIHI